jgi:DNA repair protein RecO (recombination protein O)
MSSKIIHKTPAIVLRAINYGESDRIVTFFTSDFGKLKGIAKGAKNSRRRFVNTLDPFCLSQLMFSQRNPDRLAFLEGCDMVEHYGDIRSHLDKTVFASYLVELVDAFTLEGKKNIQLFELLQDFLGLMNRTDTPADMARFFEIRLLKLVGYDPVLDRCVACHAPLSSPDGYHFHSVAGGLKCHLCSPGEDARLSVSTGTAKTLLLAQDMPIDKLGRIVLSRQAATESRRVLHRFITHILGKELKSLWVLEQIHQMGL